MQLSSVTLGEQCQWDTTGRTLMSEGTAVDVVGS